MNHRVNCPHFSLCRLVSVVALVLAIFMLCSLAVAQQQLAAAGTSTAVTGSSDVQTKAAEPAPQQPEYLVGAGDLLHVNVWKEAEISQTVVVRPDGNISLPLINEVPVAGLSPLQIQKIVTEKLKSVLTNPQVTVTVVEVRSKMVYITGEVGRPGAYPMSTPIDVLQLIARAGGLNEFANRKNIYILRKDDAKNRLHFNYKEVVKGKNREQNITLQPGDTVVVP